MTNITPQIAELLGAHIGDGTFYRTHSSLVWELRGALEEKDYYFKTICPLLKDIFNLEIQSKFRSGGAHGCWGIQTTRREIINLLLDFGFTPGTKTFTVFVPNYIFNSSLDIKRAFLRGLFDTDGCLRFDRLKKQVLYTYPKIEFCSASLALRDYTVKLLSEVGFSCYTWQFKTYYSLCIAGKAQLEKWIIEIKPGNPKHLKKYHLWKENGFYFKEALATVAQPGTAQTEQILAYDC